MTEDNEALMKVMENEARGKANERLPSTVFQEPAYAWESEEVHLRDYLNVVLRRKWLVMTFLALIFISTLIFTLASTRIYKASTCIEVTPQEQKVTKFEEIMTTDLRAREFYETQAELLRNNALAFRVIEKLQLAEHPVVIEAIHGKREKGLIFKANNFFVSLLPKGKERKPEILLDDITNRSLLLS